MITVPVWSKAPADATHFLPETGVYWAAWLKDGYSMRVADQTEWVMDHNSDEEYAMAIPRPSDHSEQLDEFRKLLERAADALDYYYPGTRLETDINSALERYR